MRRALLFIVAVLTAASSLASIPRVNVLARAREDASALLAPLPDTRVWPSDVLAPFGRPPTSALTRELHQAYGDSSTTNASGLRCFLSVDPVLGKPNQPQSWNRYAYVMNNPINRTDPDGKCSKPATSDGQVGICIEGFIAAQKVGFLGLGRGDNRTFAANDPSKTNRVQVQLVVDTKSGKIVATTRAAESTAAVGSTVIARGQGTASTTLSNATRQSDGTITFTSQTTAMNGLAGKGPAPTDSIDFKFNIAVTPGGNIGLTPGGRTDGYPSVGAYGYSNGGTVKLFENPEHRIEDLAAPMEVAIPATPPQ